MAEVEYDIDKINSFYQSTVCHVCKELSPSLKRCAGCKLYAYCSKQHQRYHWNSHREFCKMVATLLRKNGKNRKHIFDIAGAADKTFDEWQQMKVDVKYLWESLLQRKLTYGENQLWMYPRLCEICHFAQQDLLFDCSQCHSVSYCSEAHQTLHSKSHQKDCESLKLCYETNCHLLRNDEPYTVPTPRLSANLTTLPANTETFVRECTANVKSSVFSRTLAGDMLSPVLTILNAFEVTNSIAGRQFHKPTFVLHLIGAAAWYEQSFDWQMFGEFVRHWMINVEQVTVILVGPDLVPRDQQVHSAGDKCTLMLERCFYHDYVVSRAFIGADLIVALNCGLHEHQDDQANDSWALSIPCMLAQRGVPLLLTSYTRAEAQLDFQRLIMMKSNEHDINVHLQCEPNRFRSLRPLRDWSDRDSAVFYQNNYVTLVTIA